MSSSLPPPALGAGPFSLGQKGLRRFPPPTKPPPPAGSPAHPGAAPEAPTTQRITQPLVGVGAERPSKTTPKASREYKRLNAPDFPECLLTLHPSGRMTNLEEQKRGSLDPAGCAEGLEPRCLLGGRAPG